MSPVEGPTRRRASVRRRDLCRHVAL